MQTMALSLCLACLYCVESCVTVQGRLFPRIGVFPQIRKDQMNINLAWGTFFAAGFVNAS